MLSATGLLILAHEYRPSVSNEQAHQSSAAKALASIITNAIQS